MGADPARIADIARRLTETSAAHRQYELAELNGERDEQWAEWYARYLLNHGLAAALGRELDVGELAEELRRLDVSHRQNAPQREWVGYYAERMAG